MRTLFLFLLPLLLWAQEGESLSRDEVESFLFKVGFVSLAEEFDREKNTTEHHGERLDKIEADLEEIKKSLTYIMEEMRKNVREPEGLSVMETGAQEEEAEEPSSAPKPATRLFRVGVNIAAVRARPSRRASELWLLERDQLVTLEKCNRLGWCKIAGEEAYVAKFQFVEIK